MKPFYILSLVFSILSTSISAQKNSIYFGAADKNASGIQFSDENFYYELSEDKNSHLISIRKLNKKFEVEEEKTITPKYINPKISLWNKNVYGRINIDVDMIHQAELIDNTICIIYSAGNKKQKSINYSLMRVSTKNLNVVGEEKLLLNYKFKSANKVPSTPGIFKFSPDKKHL
ncbi:MAG: hypothetical protein K1X56_11500 [Flavobacteriales bacterium]|nr:hypothetical protein [Flavobacteriales bacterium]